MRSSIYNALDKLNALEKEVDRLNDKAADKYQEGKIKASDRYTRDAEDIEKEIKGMVSCLKILGLGAWCECGRDTEYVKRWHIPLDDIERVC